MLDEFAHDSDTPAAISDKTDVLLFVLRFQDRIAAKIFCQFMKGCHKRSARHCLDKKQIRCRYPTRMDIENAFKSASIRKDFNVAQGEGRISRVCSKDDIHCDSLHDESMPANTSSLGHKLCRLS